MSQPDFGGVSKESGTIFYGDYMCCSLNSLKGVISGSQEVTILGVIKGDTRSLDYGSYGECIPFVPC